MTIPSFSLSRAILAVAVILALLIIVRAVSFPHEFVALLALMLLALVLP